MPSTKLRAFLFALVAAFAWTGGPAVAQVFVPSGRYTVRVIQGHPWPANVDVEYDVVVKSVFHAEVTPRINFNDGFGWRVDSKETSRITFLNGLWEKMSDPSVGGICRYNPVSDAFEFETVTGRFPGRVYEAKLKEDDQGDG